MCTFIHVDLTMQNYIFRLYENATFQNDKNFLTNVYRFQLITSTHL